MPLPRYVIDAQAPELVAGLARIREELDVPGPPPAPALAEAEAAAGRVLAGLDQSIGRERVDARQWELITIDPPGSRDLDQALHLERRRGGGCRVRYAIADVAAFVVPGGPLDLEVWERGVTFYLPDGRAPLHPPLLGEGAASLLPDEDRPALLWTIELDDAGAVTGEARLERAVVRSRAQRTYADVQGAVDAGTASSVEKLLAEVGPRRQEIEAARGGVSLDLPTQRVTTDDGGYRLEREHVVPAMGWNAQLSLLAGMTAGDTMLRAGVGLLRTLPPPHDEVLRTVRRTARALGVDWPDGTTYQERVRTLDSDVPEEAALLLLAARGLRGAGYLALVPGEPPPAGDEARHAAIAATYAHVTAPLRRLADRYANEVCVALFAGRGVAPEISERLPDLPKAMAKANGREGAVARAVIDLVEALLLRSSVGSSLRGTVVATGEGRSTLVLPDPAVQTEIAQELPLGEDVEVRVVAADASTRSVVLEPV
ncbi:MAG: RNB domain-containing ribonuclease [Acidimicrobiales bacterium]